MGTKIKTTEPGVVRNAFDYTCAKAQIISAKPAVQTGVKIGFAALIVAGIVATGRLVYHATTSVS